MPDRLHGVTSSRVRWIVAGFATRRHLTEMQRIVTTTTNIPKKGSGQSNKKNKQQKRRKPLKQTNARKQVRGTAITVNDCTEKFLLAIAKPSDQRAHGACVPSFPARPSQKFCATGRATMTIGTTGYGFAFCCPSLANDTPSVYFSTGTYPSSGTSYPVSDTNVASGYVGSMNHSGIHAAIVLTPVNGYSGAYTFGRIISAEIRITYTGKASDLGGTVTQYTTPNHENMNSFSMSSVQGRQESRVSRVSSRPESLVVSMMTQGESEYTSYVNSAASTNYVYPLQGDAYSECIQAGIPTVGPAIGGFWVTGTPGAQFLIEYWQHMEFVGNHTQNMTSPNKTDVNGFNAAMAAVSEAPAKVASGQSYMSAIYSSFKENLISASGQVADTLSRNPRLVVTAANALSQTLGLRPTQLGAVSRGGLALEL